jgi:hypothetical protein
MKKLQIFIVLFSTLSGTSQTFTEQASALNVTKIHIDTHIMGGGAAFFDFDNDGFQDLYVTGGETRDHLYLNDQTGSFSEIGISAGLGITENIKTVGVTTGDIDNDGDRDILVTTGSGVPAILFLNNGDNTLINISSSAGIVDSRWSTSAVFGDYNNDGYLDLHIGNYVDYIDVPFYDFMTSGNLNNLYLNNGDNTFTDVASSTNTANAGGLLANTFSDYDFDSDVDLILANDFGNLYSGNALLRNNYPTDDFLDISVSADMYYEINGMGVAIGDYDEDSDLDYYITNMMANLLHTNNNDQTFINDAFNSGTEAVSTVSWGTFFFDYDNDSYLDLFSASGGVMTMAVPQLNNLFENQQNGTFIDNATLQGVSDTCRSRGAAFGDIDNDGDLDIIVVNVDSDSINAKSASLYVNNTNGASNYLAVNLVGTTSNRDAFGSRVRVVSNGRSWIREINGGSSYLSQNSSVAHFGLDNLADIDTIEVTWPNGEVQIDTNVNMNETITITQDELSGLPKKLEESDLIIFPNPTNKNITVSSSEIINSILITTLGGRTLKEMDTYSIKQAFDVSELPEGIYLIVINNALVRKLIIAR